ncbi:glycosyltransferase family 4 protein [Candidatus Falkowbacteria bacterium]|nr:glycosyltransferase family 4 protein [Candidatus Falkowbacteria bacterium]
MPKTLLITIDFPPMFGGVANYWANLCKILPNDKIVVLASECDDSLDFDVKQNYLIYRKVLISKQKWLWPKWLPFLFWSFKLAHAEGVGKIIVAHILPGGTIAYILKLLLGIPYIVSVHGLDIALPQRNKRKLWLMKKILRRADAVIANSDYTKNELLKLGCADELKIEIVYPCSNINSAPIDVEKIQEFLRQHKLENKKIILTTGRLIERKGHDKVIEALPQIIAAAPDVVYLIVGNGENLDNLRARALEKNLQDRVLFFTDIMDSEMPIFYQAADVFIMPCRCLDNGDIEGFGIVFLEASLFGKPAIAGRSGGAVEAIEHNVSGLLVDPLNVDEIARAAIALLGDEKRARELGEAGKQRVLRKFNWQEQGRKLERIINN